jgi:predicted PurR-regulated permease PerM
LNKIIRYTILILITLSVLVVLWQFNVAILVFFLSLATAASIRPGIEYFQRHNLSHIQSLSITYLISVLVLGGLVIGIFGPLLQDLGGFSDDFTQAYERAKTQWPQGETTLKSTLAEQLPEPSDLYDALTSEQGITIAQSILGAAANFFDLLGKIGIILILSIYWSADRIHFERLWLSLIPAGQRKRARDTWRAIEDGVGAFIRSQVVQSLVAVVLLWLGYWMIGLDYPALLAISSTLFLLIPWVGTLLAIVPPFLVGLSAHFGLGILAAFYTALVMIILELIIEPRFYQREKYSSLLIVLIMLVLALGFGVLGVIFAAPLAAAIQILFDRLVLPRRHEEKSSEIEQIDDLNLRLSNLQKMITGSEEPLSPETISLTERLENLVLQTKSYLENEL